MACATTTPLHTDTTPCTLEEPVLVILQAAVAGCGAIFHEVVKKLELPAVGHASTARVGSTLVTTG